MNIDFKNYLLKVSQSSDCKEIEVIQSLWSGYGKISRYKLIDSQFETVVVKCISLYNSSDHPRGWNTDKSHDRKVKSYQVEAYWYANWNQQCHANCRVPKSLGSFSVGVDQWIVLEDLDPYFPVRKNKLTFSEVQVCLKWLANFHATFLSRKPVGLWEVGTYWHLDTRPDEFEKIEHQELKSKAHQIDEMLNQCIYQTIVHGDAKLANFCFSLNGEHVVAVDFQYVGGGCGMKDVAYFLGSCLSGPDCELYQDELLGYYFSELEGALQALTLNLNFEELKDEWTRMYPIACADFTRFMLGWMPAHQKVNDYSMKLVNAVLGKL
jgi:hypothetical protein